VGRRKAGHIMSIEVTKRYDRQFPIGIQRNGNSVKLYTLAAAKELRTKLSDAIEWAVNMEDLRKEKEAHNG